MTIIDIGLNFTNEIRYTTELLQSEGITVNDTKLLLTIESAYNAICKYLGVSNEYNSEYMTATVQLAVVYYNLPQGFSRVTQKTQGARSQTLSSTTSALDNDGLTQLVKSMLPYPKLRVI